MTLLYFPEKKQSKENKMAHNTVVAKCPICKTPMFQGTQLYCEPGVCFFRDEPYRYETKPQLVAFEPAMRKVGI